MYDCLRRVSLYIFWEDMGKKFSPDRQIFFLFRKYRFEIHSGTPLTSRMTLFCLLIAMLDRKMLFSARATNCLGFLNVGENIEHCND
jgi:hypothetical protein